MEIINRCGECVSYIGGGDWDLCCAISHPTPEEKRQGKSFIFGHLCYESSPACDMFKSKENSEIGKD